MFYCAINLGNSILQRIKNIEKKVDMVINDQKKSNQKLDLILDEIKSIKFYGVVDQEFLNVNIFVYFF